MGGVSSPGRKREICVTDNRTVNVLKGWGGTHHPGFGDQTQLLFVSLCKGIPLKYREDPLCALSFCCTDGTEAAAHLVSTGSNKQAERTNENQLRAS